LAIDKKTPPTYNRSPLFLEGKTKSQLTRNNGMFHRLHNRAGHYLLLIALWAVSSLPNLGKPSLWDIDEGHNAECAREMLDSGNWLVPTFNFQLRDHKPPLLYWLQIAAYERFGVSEFSARLPSALAALAAVLLTYEMGRLLFGLEAGLLAGLILASAPMFCAAGHFANPDSLLNALNLATMFFFWRSLERSSSESRLNGMWIIPTALCMALAVMTKGPVGLLLPMAVIIVYLTWSRQLRVFLDFRVGWGVLAFILVAVPWYAWISAETKGEFTRGFFLTHNFGRFLNPMENHRGPIYYYPIALLLGFGPWSPFLILTIFYEFRCRNEKVENRPEEVGNPRRFLVCWIVVYLVFFSLSGTKLPNYILPIYPAAALLTGQFLNRWQRGLLPLPGLVIYGSLAGVALVGLGFGLAVLGAGGVLNVPALRGRVVPGLETWAFVGLILVGGALLAGWLLREDKKAAAISSLAGAVILFVSTLAAWGSLPVDACKAPRSLVDEAGAGQTEHDIRIGCYQFYQPSLVFYCRREVRILQNENEAQEFFLSPLPVYLFVSAQEWEALSIKIRCPHRLLARHGDLYKGLDVVVVTNQ
jgi:4-amino-4-deoxy-L-arabinose transferase-like glycosyltransferase